MMPNETKWTPGPWQVDSEYLDDIRDVTGVNLVAQAYVVPISKGGGCVRRANARLIAKAPEMYAELNRIRAALIHWGSAAEIRDELISEIVDLLAKARGEI